MKQKKLFGFDYTDNEFIKVVLYLVVGGTAALVEWGLFYTFAVVFALNYLLSTAAAYFLSTIYHYVLGNILVFNSGARYGRKKELFLVFAVSIMGLLLNLLLMYVFVGCFMMQPMFAKILTTALVVVWNYLARKKWIF